MYQSASCSTGFQAIMSSALNDALDDARRLGYTVVGHDGRGHIRLHHADGAGYSLATTPSDWRTYLNARRDMEKIAGAKLPRARSGRHPHRRQPLSNFRKTAAERSAGAEVEQLVCEAEKLSALHAEIVAAAAADARQVELAYSAIRRRLAALHRIVPPIGAARCGRRPTARPEGRNTPFPAVRRAAGEEATSTT